MDWANAVPWIVAGLAVFVASGGHKYLKGLVPTGGALPEAVVQAVEAQAARLGEEVSAVQKSRSVFDGVVDDLGKSAAHQHDMATVAGRVACYDCLAGWLSTNGSVELVGELDAKVVPRLFKREAA